MSEFLGSAAGLTFAILLVAATFLLYFFKHLTESFERRRHASAKAERLVGALYAEIQANVEGLRDFLDHTPPAPRASGAPRGEQARRMPYAAVANTLVYESHVGDLASLPHSAVLKVVAFYSQLERVSALLETVERASLGDFGADQQARAAEDLRRHVERGEKLGREALHALEVHLPLGVMRKALAAA